MPFLAHLDELRKRLIVSFSAIGIGFVLVFNLRDRFIQLLQWPLMTDVVMGRRFPFVAFQHKPPIAKLTALGPAETLWTHFKVAFIAGLLVAIPVVLYELWRFIAPGLLPKERRFALPFVVLSTAFFFLGVTFCFFIVLPLALQFLLTFDPSIQQTPRFSEYVDFTLKFLLAFGVIFELPLAMVIAARLGMVTPQFLARNRKYAILVNFIIAAILTPTPDVFNQSLMALPMCLLYEIGILASRFIVPRPKPAEG
ncbi:MAG TPA: twin-arginine translocase subunit TatC [Candidatus Methylomirabilis sp.]|nr:twin-arginine translocase subunit TatC [Candidatus Methylomirabilis sp.]HSC70389.1 twin-arginine translocase subunit TatC [Candidatus Methylomirabilis sp.]